MSPEELPKALDPAMAAAMAKAIKSLGFRFIALDLEGYRTGSLNEVLNNRDRLDRNRLGPTGSSR